MKFQHLIAKTLLISAALTFKAIEGPIISGPSNVAINKGFNSTFLCSSSTSLGLVWLYTKDGNSSYHATSITSFTCTVLSNYTNHFKTYTNKPNYECNLIIFDALVSHGGYYTCIERYTALRADAILVVLDPTDSDIISNKTEEIVNGDAVYIENSINYGGPLPNSYGQAVLPPVFEWALQSNASNILPSSSDSSWNTSSSYLTVTASIPVVPSYISTLFFNSPKGPPSTCANNTPTYTFNWTTPETVVYYLNPPNIDILNHFEPHHGCEARILRCVPNGYPPPTIQWTDMKTMETFDSETITAELNGTYKCITRNRIRGEEKIESTMHTVDSKGFTWTPCKFVSSENLEIILPDGSLCEGDTCFSPSCSEFNLRCRFTSIPEATYKWIYGEQGEEVDGDTVEATEDGNYTCQASNMINDRVVVATRTVTISVHCVPAPRPPPLSSAENTNDDALIIISVLFGVSVIINIVFVVFFFFCLRQKPTSQNVGSNGPLYEQPNSSCRPTVGSPSEHFHEGLREEPPVYSSAVLEMANTKR